MSFYCVSGHLLEPLILSMETVTPLMLAMESMFSNNLKQVLDMVNIKFHEFLRTKRFFAEIFGFERKFELANKIYLLLCVLMIILR